MRRRKPTPGLAEDIARQSLELGELFVGRRYVKSPVVAALGGSGKIEFRPAVARATGVVRRHGRRARYRGVRKDPSTYSAPPPSRTCTPSSARWHDEISFKLFGAEAPIGVTRVQTGHGAACGAARLVVKCSLRVVGIPPAPCGWTKAGTSSQHAQRGQRMEIRVEGVFDPAAARVVAGRILVVPATTALVVDFTNVVEFHDSAAAVLAQALADRTLVTLRGVGHHHLRLLRYLGARSLEATLRHRESDDV